jgi:putative transport protein
MQAFLSWLHEPLVALFVVAAFGFLLGKLKVRGVGLGVAAVLFVGLAFSASVKHIELPDLIPKMGLCLFIYAIGLSSGPGFFALFRKRGLRDGTLALLVLVGVMLAA